MDIDPRDKQKQQKDKVEKERRGFLKKAVYTAPSLIVLSQLARPARAKAWGENPPSDPQYVE